MFKRTLIKSRIPNLTASNLILDLTVLSAILSFGFVAAIVFGVFG